MINQNLSVSKSNQFHVVIFRGLFINFDVYTIDSSRMMHNSFEVLKSNWLFLKLKWFICKQQSVLPICGLVYPFQLFLSDVKENLQ